jgi:hypothetical protein
MRLQDLAVCALMGLLSGCATSPPTVVDTKVFYHRLTVESRPRNAEVFTTTGSCMGKTPFSVRARLGVELLSNGSLRKTDKYVLGDRSCSERVHTTKKRVWKKPDLDAYRFQLRGGSVELYLGGYAKERVSLIGKASADRLYHSERTVFLNPATVSGRRSTRSRSSSGRSSTRARAGSRSGNRNSMSIHLDKSAAPVGVSTHHGNVSLHHSAKGRTEGISTHHDSVSVHHSTKGRTSGLSTHSGGNSVHFDTKGNMQGFSAGPVNLDKDMNITGFSVPSGF